MTYYSFNTKSDLSKFFAQEGFLNAKMHFLNELELYLNKTIGQEDDVRCNKCGSDNVDVKTAQLRATDESGTATAICNNCNNRFAPH